MDGELLLEVIQRIERMTGIEPLLILAVAALDLAVVPGSVGADQLVPNPQFCGSPFKQRLFVPATV